MTSNAPGALILTLGKFQTPNAKTAHGLIRGTTRFTIRGVIDETFAGHDAGELLDGRTRGIPVYASLDDALTATLPPPSHVIVGIATAGGVLPDSLREILLRCLERGLSIVNGLHDLVSEDAELRSTAERTGAHIVDIRKPRPFRELRFWTGRIKRVESPRIAVLGTDCALGKRTTCSWLTEGCLRSGVKAEMIYTGQTGWLQGYPYGFILDATPNDFVSGELEHAIVTCWEETRPDLIFIEGQSGLRNPTGPCGSEFILSGGAHGVILQHAPSRVFYKGTDHLEFRIPELADEIELIGRYGARTLAITLNETGLQNAQAERIREDLEREFRIPVVRPLHETPERLVNAVLDFTGKRETR